MVGAGGYRNCPRTFLLSTLAGKTTLIAKEVSEGSLPCGKHKKRHTDAGEDVYKHKKRLEGIWEE